MSGNRRDSASVKAKPQGKGASSTSSASTPSSVKVPSSSKEESSDISIDELGMINSQLLDLVEEIKIVREDLKMVMKRDDMIAFIKETVTKIVNDLTENMDVTISMKVEDKTKELKDRMSQMEKENTQLSNQLKELKNEMKDLKDADIRSKAALSRANFNEQYSRKNNVKIMNLEEKGDETDEKLMREVCELFQTKQVDISPEKVLAVHRIPGKAGQPKPVLVKLINNSEKTKIMRKRSLFKTSGNRLVDDVTKLNAALIQRLNEHEAIEQAWYFNGFVYARAKSSPRKYKFDIFDEVEEILTKAARQK